jgi:hypothetical protein
MYGDEAFRVLSLAPTLDLAAVKRAYFESIARCPPHADAEGFRAIRAAYEALCKPGALAAAFMASPLDLEAALQRHDALGATIARADAHARATRARAAEIAVFVARASGTTLDAAVRTYGG